MKEIKCCPFSTNDTSLERSRDGVHGDVEFLCFWQHYLSPLVLITIKNHSKPGRTQEREKQDQNEFFHRDFFSHLLLHNFSSFWCIFHHFMIKIDRDRCKWMMMKSLCSSSMTKSWRKSARKREKLLSPLLLFLLLRSFLLFDQ